MTRRASGRSRAGAGAGASPATVPARVREVLSALKACASRTPEADLARFGITARHAYGVTVPEVRRIAKGMGRDHALALALWETGCYDARLVACFVDDPARVTPAQMDRWARTFESWADTDTACFHLFDKTGHAWSKVGAWRRRRGELEKRAAFALLASLALHDREAPEAPFLRALPWIEDASEDGRNYVKKGVSWALRGIGTRSRALHAASVALARRLADSEVPSARWIGKDALRDLSRPVVARRIESRRGRSRS